MTLGADRRAAAAPVAAGLAHRLASQLERSHRALHCPGVTASIVDGRHGTWHGASGVSNVDARSPLSPNARCYTYSITKTFTAVRVLQLVAQRRVSIDEPVGDQLDGPIASQLHRLRLADRVTVRRLLNHTAGVPSYTDWPDYAAAVRAAPERPWTDEQVVARACAGPVQFEPGTGWHYSNTGYLLLRRLIEVTTGQSYADAIAEGIAAPLGLCDTVAVSNVGGAAATPGYGTELSGCGHIENVVPRYHPGWCLTGLIESSSADVARFYDALFDGALLAPPLLSQMTTEVPIGSESEPHFRRPAYGLGLMVDREWGHGGLFGHGGGGPGFTTWAMHLPEFDGRTVTLVALCNASSCGLPIPLARDLLAVLRG